MAKTKFKYKVVATVQDAKFPQPFSKLEDAELELRRCENSSNIEDVEMSSWTALDQLWWEQKKIQLRTMLHKKVVTDKDALNMLEMFRPA